MSDKRPHSILDYLRRIHGVTANNGVSDADLLRRYVEERDEAAFELLLWRHAATVQHVCRRVLRDADAVEDAFQATFLVFVRNAASISRRESLGGWLYRVAYRIALKARQRMAKRKAAEQEGQPIDPPDPSTEDAERRELRRIVCEEVDRLPAKYRAAIVACFFEGKTHEEAAVQLGWPRGSVASRVARGRDLLHRRLLRRGIALTATALSTALSVQTSSAALRGLIQATIQTVKLFAVGSSAAAVVPPSIATLAEGVLQAMYWTRVKIVMAILFVAGLGGAGATFWAAPPKTTKPPSETAPRAEAPAVPGGDKAEKPNDADKLTPGMKQSRRNLQKLAEAMRDYARKNNNRLPPPAIYDKKGKALLSWRVALLPYLDQNNLYKQFHLDEPWDSEHNKSLAKIVVKAYVPVVKPETPRWRTYYQVFVGATKKGQAGGAALGRGGPGGPPGLIDSRGITAFVKRRGMLIPADFTDGLSNTILIVEAGNAVPWTKPEDLHYADDKPLPELGGLFPDVFQAIFANGSVRTLTKKYDEASLRAAITANGGEVFDREKIEYRPFTIAELQWENAELGAMLEGARRRLGLLKGKHAFQEKRSNDPQLEKLKRENARLRAELDRVRAESKTLSEKKPAQKKNP